MANYIATDVELTATADSIRDITGDNENIEWKQNKGFKDALDAITKKSAATYTPTTVDQTIAAGQYLSGDQTIEGEENLVAGNIKTGVSIFGVTGSYGGAPEAQLDSKSISANGTYNASADALDGYSSVSVNVPNSYAAGDEGKVVSSGSLVAQSSKSITTNGTHDTTTNNSVTVSVPNSYAAGDEGKVVSSGELVAQSSKSISSNGTHDTTTNDEVVVNVPGVVEIPKASIGYGDGAQEMPVVFGPIESIPDTSITLANSSGQAFTIDTGSAFEITVSFKLSQLPAQGLSIMSLLNRYAIGLSINKLSNGGTTIHFSYTKSDNSTGNIVAYYNNGTPLPLNTVIKVVVSYSGSGVTADTYIDGIKVDGSWIVATLKSYVSSVVLGGPSYWDSIGMNKLYGSYFDISGCTVKQGNTALWGTGTSTKAFVGSSEEATTLSGLYGPMGIQSGCVVPRYSDGEEVEVDSTEPYEIQTIFKISSIPSTGVITFLKEYSSTHYAVAVWAQNQGTVIGYSVGYTNSSSQEARQDGYFTLPSGYVLPTNVYITARITYDGDDHVFYLNDGSNEYTETVNGLTPWPFDFVPQFGLTDIDGMAIIVGESYIKQNDDYLWIGNGKIITSNGTYNASSDGLNGYAGVVVDLPNTYSSSDEGKVVHNGALTSQTLKNVSWNGVYDITTNDVLVVNRTDLGVSAKLGSSSTVTTLGGIYGPMGDGANDYIIPVYNGSNVVLNIGQPYEIKFTFWATKASRNITIPSGSAVLPIWLFGGKTNYRLPSVVMYATMENDELSFYYSFNLQKYNGTSWVQTGYVFSDYTSTVSFPAYSPIQIKISYDGTDVVLSIDDGIHQDSYTLEDVYAPQTETGVMSFGACTPDLVNLNGEHPFEFDLCSHDWAYIDIGRSYIKQNGSYIWHPGDVDIEEEEIVDDETASEEAGT